MKPSQNLMLVLILTLIVLTCGLIVWIAFFQLQAHSGIAAARDRPEMDQAAGETRLDLIRSTYDQTVDEGAGAVRAATK